jgi:hypothetical protein
MSKLNADTGVRWGDADAQRDYRGTRRAVQALPRDNRIDSLRGLMLAEITLVHIHCPIALISYEFFGRVSPAAGFVFLSGLVAGAVYSRAAEKGTAVIVQRCLRRCLHIHAYHLVAFLTLLAVAVFQPRANTYFQFAIGQSAAGVTRALGWFAVWAYQPNLFDILPMYGLFVLCMPAALIALRRNHGLALLLVSFGVWTLAQIGLGRIVDSANHFGFFQGDFNPFAWQFVFFAGLYFGHMHLYRGHRVVEVRPALVALCLLICMVGFTMRWQLLHWPAAFGADSRLASKQDYGAAYLVNFLAFSYLVYSLATRFPRAFNWPAFAFLGRHSLQVFSFHVVAVYLASPLIWRAAVQGPWAYNALGAALVASLFAAAWCHSRWRTAMPALHSYLGRDERVVNPPELQSRQ